MDLVLMLKNLMRPDPMQRRFDKAFRYAGLSSVPSVVVNNKDLLTPDGIIDYGAG